MSLRSWWRGLFERAPAGPDPGLASAPMTTPPPREAGKRGRNQAIRDYPELALTRFAKAPAPAPPSGDVSRGISAWLMLGNDQQGDCGPCALEHARMAKAATGATPDGSGTFPAGFAVPTVEHTLSTYWNYGIAQGEQPPRPDQGVENASLLLWLYEQTAGTIPVGGDIRLWAFAQINRLDANAVHAAMLDFSGVLLGVNLTGQAETEFSNHQPWDVNAQEQPDPNMGHDVLLVAYDNPKGMETVITWGALQECTVAWEAGAVAEAWVFITEEDATRNGVDFAALRAEIASLGGVVNPNIPTPAPAPTPEPTPPDPVPAPAPQPEPQPPVGFEQWVRQELQAIRADLRRLVDQLT